MDQEISTDNNSAYPRQSPKNSKREINEQPNSDVIHLLSGFQKPVWSDVFVKRITERDQICNLKFTILVVGDIIKG